jgi:hypothetical protein
MPAFTGKGRFAGLLQTTPVHVVTINAAMLGARLYGLGWAIDPLGRPGPGDALVKPVGF